MTNPQQPTQDLYRVLGLDPNAPSPVLVGQVDQLLAKTPPGSNRDYLENAKATFSDPDRRRELDSRLAAERAPGWHQGASGPSKQGGPFAGLPKWLLPAVAGVLVLVLVTAVAASCSGGGGNSAEPTASGTSESTTQSGTTTTTTTSAASSGKLTETNLNAAEWSTSSGAEAPVAALYLTAAYDLPPAVVTGSPRRQQVTPRQELLPELVQTQDKNITVVVKDPSSTSSFTAEIAMFTPDGQLVPSGTTVPQDFDLARKSQKGYYRVIAESGITIAASANGTKPEMQYVAVKPDAFDDTVFWVVARGGDKLYRAELRKA